MDIAHLGDDVGITVAWIGASDESGDGVIKYANSQFLDGRPTGPSTRSRLRQDVLF